MKDNDFDWDLLIGDTGEINKVMNVMLDRPNRNLTKPSDHLTELYLMNKNFDLKYLLIPLFLVSPFYSNIINKLERVMFGNYWDPFFISNGPNSIQDYIQNFYFLNSMFIKSLFIENLLIVGLVLYLFSILITYFSREPILVYSLLALAVLNLSSFFKIYPLGAGRTDIVFLPCLLYTSDAADE